MEFNAANAQALLARFEFSKLFVDELGWDRHNVDLAVDVSGVTIQLKAVAEKRGMVAWLCEAPPGERIPERATRKRIDQRVAKATLEHLIVFIDGRRNEQIWSWSRREAGKPASVPEHFWYAGSGNRGFLQKLQAIAFSFAEESTLTLLDVTARARSAFDVDRVTKRFYEQFKAEHKAFIGFIGGIADLGDREWYASLMLNRLMFIYFMQRKLFLNGERDYLRDRLARSKREAGRDRFYSFYRYFLLRLFHDGLGGKERDPELDKLLGRIPYLNGGLFEKHPIEERCPNINIPDEAFERIFEYFDRYQWHLDERPLRNDDEINPDVLGYIFEKYINQKQMGAYYTKEDITGYICKSTIIPYLFDAAKKNCKVAFENPGGPTVWDYLRDDPDRYIYTSVRHGVENPLPAEIDAGLLDASARSRWNRPAPAEFGLPTETWREVVARRARYAELKASLGTGEVRQIDELIAHNLDIGQFALDVIERCDGPDLLRACWSAIEGVSVLDPTCGSGAFLFAALNILEPLYETCLSRMEAFVSDFEREGAPLSPRRFEDFEETLQEVGAHPNTRYFILKSIILNNLFGVDIMEEAVEICKLRLFLKLAAQVEPDQSHQNLGIEPLPDIDFNIRSGNTLVGYATLAAVKEALSSKLDLDNTSDRIATKAAELQSVFDAFRAKQMEGDGAVPVAEKVALRDRLSGVDDELNQHLAAEYGVTVADSSAYSKWTETHQPFHWFIEFYRIMQAGGFDVIVGNPPFVEYTKVQKLYRVKGFKSAQINNLYAFVAERCRGLIQRDGCLGLVLPNSSVSAEKMRPLQEILRRDSHCYISNFAWRPSKLFDGANMLVAIWVVHVSRDARTYSTRYLRWFSPFREVLFSTFSYTDVTSEVTLFRIPKMPDQSALAIFAKLERNDAQTIAARASGGRWALYYFRAVLYWFKVLDEPPVLDVDGVPSPTGEMKKLSFAEKAERDAALCILASNLYAMWYVTWSSCQVVNSPDLQFPVNLQRLVETRGTELSSLSAELMKDLQINSVIQTRNYAAKGRTFEMKKQYFFVKKSKAIIDRIDEALAGHFGFDGEELDYITNYDVRFRTSADEDEDET